MPQINSAKDLYLAEHRVQKSPSRHCLPGIYHRQSCRLCKRWLASPWSWPRYFLGKIINSLIARSKIDASNFLSFIHDFMGVIFPQRRYDKKNLYQVNWPLPSNQCRPFSMMAPRMKNTMIYLLLKHKIGGIMGQWRKGLGSQNPSIRARSPLKPCHLLVRCRLIIHLFLYFLPTSPDLTPNLEVS